MTKQRFNYTKDMPNAIKGMLEIEKFVHSSDMEQGLFELVKMRVSQINRCGYCIDMHSKDARKAGETEQRLYALSAWRETPFFTYRERAALEWAEELTLISQNKVNDELYNKMLQHFTEKELMTLTMAIVAINGWNRLAISFRSVTGSYDPQ